MQTVKNLNVRNLIAWMVHFLTQRDCKKKNTQKRRTTVKIKTPDVMVF